MEGKIPFVNGTVVGHYRISIATGLTTGLSAGNPIFSARWNSALGIRSCLLRLRIYANPVTPFTSAQEVSAAAYVARGWTVADSGGSAIVLTGLNNMQNSLADVPSIADIRAATTGTLTAGTRTLDANPFLQLSTSQLLGAASASDAAYEVETGLFSEMQSPWNLNSLTPNQEGIVVTAPVAQGAGGTVRYIIGMEWLEYQGAANVGTLT